MWHFLVLDDLHVKSTHSALLFLGQFLLVLYISPLSPAKHRLQIGTITGSKTLMVP